MGWAALRDVAGIAAGHLLRRQTNFLKALWRFRSVYNPERLLANHGRSVRYEMAVPAPRQDRAAAGPHYIHAPRGRRGRSLDKATERFVDASRMDTSD